jgi:hypothetical protein
METDAQQTFLSTCKNELGVTWDEFAALAGVEPRAFKSYRMPRTSTANYRPMNKLVRAAIERVMEKHRAG